MQKSSLKKIKQEESVIFQNYVIQQEQKSNLFSSEIPAFRRKPN